MTKFGKGIGGALLTLAFVLGISAATSVTARAQYRNNDDRYQRQDRDGDNDNDRNRERRWRRHRDRDNNRERRDRNRNYDYGRNGGYGNYGGYGGYGNGGYNNGYRIEQNQGYQAGVYTGSRDAQRGQSFNPQRSHYYKDARTQAFRQGFVQGYDQGYRQYAGYGTNGRYRRNTGGILGGIFGRP